MENKILEKSGTFVSQRMREPWFDLGVLVDRGFLLLTPVSFALVWVFLSELVDFSWENCGIQLRKKYTPRPERPLSILLI